MTEPSLEQRAVNVVRGLSMDAVQRANSGHPGTPMALAPLAHVLYTRIMRYDASEPEWADRDRLVLSAGHASMLLYSMLHLCGFGLTVDDLREFRQWGSRTPGHPERGHTDGVEVTTGPLGQGFANGVGMAIAERHLRERFGADLCDHRIYAICSDGDIQEGITHEAAALAGHLGLGRLIYVYDDNGITIDGRADLAMSEDVPARFRAYGWHVVELGDVANDLDALERGLRDAIAVEDRPSLVVIQSHIGYPSPKFTDTAAAHGSPLGADEVRVTKEILGLDPDAEFAVPDDVLALYRAAGARGRAQHEAWAARREQRRDTDPAVFAEYEACTEGRGLSGWQEKMPSFETGAQIATRVACATVLSTIGEVVPGLVGGSADLTGNTGVKMAGAKEMHRGDATGRLVHFGIREHAMGAIANGMALSGLSPFVGTFFVFADYMRPAVRLAALQRTKVAFVWSHDSVGVGEDGPTHQPIEQLASLRAIPGLRVIRPADANETAHAWSVHLESQGPTGLVLTRQNVPVLEATALRAAEGVPRGGYVLVDEAEGRIADVVLVGTGSEVSLCLAAHELLTRDGVAVRVVSLPSWELFEEQSDDYRRRVLPPEVPTLAVEAGSRLGWSRYADDVIGIDRFGASAPAAVVLERYGFTAEAVAEHARELMSERSRPR